MRLFYPNLTTADRTDDEETLIFKMVLRSNLLPVLPLYYQEQVYPTKPYGKLLSHYEGENLLYRHRHLRLVPLDNHIIALKPYRMLLDRRV